MAAQVRLVCDEERVGERDGSLVVDRERLEDEGDTFAAHELFGSLSTSKLMAKSPHPMNAARLEEADCVGGGRSERWSRERGAHDHSEAKGHSP